ncbi:hypothetical protein DFH06DRAFT_1210883 [Mycena polygramma]|nr:hypothetical protein DFH06DRAFT_1210883 [Mycena polygramma]
MCALTRRIARALRILFSPFPPTYRSVSVSYLLSLILLSLICLSVPALSLHPPFSHSHLHIPLLHSSFHPFVLICFPLSRTANLPGSAHLLPPYFPCPTFTAQSFLPSLPRNVHYNTTAFCISLPFFGGGGGVVIFIAYSLVFLRLCAFAFAFLPSRTTLFYSFRSYLSLPRLTIFTFL